MPRWIELPKPQLKHHPYQAAFWEARRARTCPKCKIAFENPPDLTCPNCKELGVRKFHRLLMISGRRGGKTAAGAIAAVEEALIPGTIGWCCAPTNPKLHRYVLPALQQLIPQSWVSSWSSEFNDIRLKNGSLIHLQTLEDPDQGRGQGLHWVWIDEVCELTEKHWEVLRPSLTEHRGVAFFTTSPRSYDWVYDNFYIRSCDCSGRCSQPWDPATRSGHVPGYWAARYATIDNPIISAEELEEAKSTMSPTMYRQEYEADFVTFTGSVYGEFLQDRHILRTEPDIKRIIPSWPDISTLPTLVGIDTGADHPFGALKLVSTESGLVIVGEYLERDKTFTEHAAALRRLAGSNNVKWAINKNERQAMTEFAQAPHHIFCQKAENDQVAGIERVKTWLHNGQLFFVEPLCQRTIRQMKAYRWAENVSPKDGSQRKERVFKKDDELPDCLRYALMTWPILPKPKPAETVRDLSKLPDDMRRTIERMRRIDEDLTKVEPEGTVGDFWL